MGEAGEPPQPAQLCAGRAQHSCCRVKAQDVQKRDWGEPDLQTLFCPCGMCTSRTARRSRCNSCLLLLCRIPAAGKPRRSGAGETAQPECNYCSPYRGRACCGGEYWAARVCDPLVGPTSSHKQGAGWWMGVLGSCSQKPSILWEKTLKN